MNSSTTLTAAALLVGGTAFAQDSAATTSSSTNDSSAPAITLEPSSDIGRDGKRFGVGAMVGEPFGASLKYWITDNGAIDGGIGWSLFDGGNFQAHGGYIHHLFDVIPVDQGQLPIYFGGGLRFKARDNQDDWFGIRAVAGLNYMFENRPIDVFVEAGPVLDFTPDTKLRFTAAIGARYWF